MLLDVFIKKLVATFFYLLLFFLDEKKKQKKSRLMKEKAKNSYLLAGRKKTRLNIPQSAGLEGLKQFFLPNTGQQIRIFMHFSFIGRLTN